MIELDLRKDDQRYRSPGPYAPAILGWAISISRSVVLAMVALALVVSFPLHPSQLWGQSRGSRQVNETDWARGYHGFGLLCRSLGLEFEGSINRWKRVPAKDRILISFGELIDSYNPIDIRSFHQQGGAVFCAVDRRANLPVLSRMIPAQLTAPQNSRAYLNYRDCPLVTEFENHPVVDGINSVATNRPGGIVLEQNKSFQSIASFPFSVAGGKRADFMVASRDAGRPHVLFCSDPSAFTNQMLFQLDNARLALQTLAWLKENERKRILFLVDGIAVVPQDPRNMNLNFPPPSRRQVLNALRNLPPNLMLQVGNQLAATIEDEDLVNEFMGLVFEDTSQVKLIRGLIFAFTMLLAGFLFFRYMSSESTIQDATGTDFADSGPRLGWWRRRKKASADCHRAAELLISRFYERVSEGKQKLVGEFPAGLKIVNAVEKQALSEQFESVSRRLGSSNQKWWTSQRLEQLNSQIEMWDYLFRNGRIIYGPGDNDASANDNSASPLP